MAKSEQREAVEQSWHLLQQTAAKYGGTWLVLGADRRKILERALSDLGPLGTEGLILAIEGYAHRTRNWDKRLEYLKPESIFRPTHLALNVEAGAEARAEALQADKIRSAEATLLDSMSKDESLWG